jgi:hypothetical protein
MWYALVILMALVGVASMIVLISGAIQRDMDKVVGRAEWED